VPYQAAKKLVIRSARFFKPGVVNATREVLCDSIAAFSLAFTPVWVPAGASRRLTGTLPP
jgi:hypothetical protein